MPYTHRSGIRLGSLLALLLLLPMVSHGQQSSEDPLALGPRTDEHPVKYAIYSTAWAVNSNDGLRIVAHNRGDRDVILRSVIFRDNAHRSDDIELEIDLAVPARGWAETETAYIELMTGNDCVEQTLQEDWRIKEISNYTLNPSVRGLIIEDTRSFRIFQCVREVQLSWEDEDGERHSERQWVMYHFERLPPN